MAQACKERKIRVMRHVGAGAEYGEQEREKSAKMTFEFQQKRKFDLISITKLRKIVEVNLDLPVVQNEMVMKQDWTIPARETLVILKQFRRQKFQTIVNKIIFRIRFAQRLKAIKNAKKQAQEAQAFHRPFLPPIPMLEALELPPPLINAQLSLPALPGFPIQIHDIKYRPPIKTYNVSQD